MPSEMRRPGPVKIDNYIALLDTQLRGEVSRVERHPMPFLIQRIARVLKTALQPLIQSGAVVLTSIAVIVAVGVAPATMSDPPPVDTPLADPGGDFEVVTDQSSYYDRLPPDEFLAVESFQGADNRDTPRMEME